MIHSKDGIDRANENKTKKHGAKAIKFCLFHIYQ